MLCGMPYLDTGINALSQVIEAGSGEKSWSRASVDGGAAIGAIMGSAMPVVGTMHGVDRLSG